VVKVPFPAYFNYLRLAGFSSPQIPDRNLHHDSSLPSHAHSLVGQGDRRNIWMTALYQLRHPSTQAIVLMLGLGNHSASAMNQDATQIGVTAFADAQ
jgi:hypothetical protein